jgi:hypothetical protein
LAATGRLAYDPWNDGKTAIRGGFGLYFDQVFLNIPLNAEDATKFVGTLIANPGYPDALGPNPNRTGGPITPTPNTVLFAADADTPYTRQGTIGVSREIAGGFALTADFVAANGYELLVTRDLNTPSLSDPARRRPNPAFGFIRAVESRGHSWYKALQTQVVRRHANRYSFSVAYTLSESERDTEDFNFTAQDQSNFDAERGPSLSDARHQFGGSLNVDLWYGVRVTTVLSARSALPYNVTTGRDDNRDGTFNDRPGTRNSARGADSWTAHLRLAKDFTWGTRRVELLAEAFNVTNRRNWTTFIGNRLSASFGRPTNAEDPRQIQLGLKVDF